MDSKVSINIKHKKHKNSPRQVYYYNFIQESCLKVMIRRKFEKQPEKQTHHIKKDTE